MTAPSPRCEEEQGPCGAALMGWGFGHVGKGVGDPFPHCLLQRENPVAKGAEEIWGWQRWGRNR